MLRMTAVKGFNMHGEKGYAESILLAEPEYVEVKSYMHRGSSTLRLSQGNMPSHSETMGFARRIAEETGYLLCDESEPSRVALLARDGKAEKSRMMEFPG